MKRRYLVSPTNPTFTHLNLSQEATPEARRDLLSDRRQQARMSPLHVLGEMEQTRDAHPHYFSAIETAVLSLTQEQAEAWDETQTGLRLWPDEPLPLVGPLGARSAIVHQPSPHDLWHLEAVGLSDARRAHPDENGDGVTVAVLDTGLDAQHADLQGKVASALRCTEQQDGTLSWASQPSNDSHGHGTHVGGLLVSKTVGVAPGARLLDVGLLYQNKGTIATFVSALQWLAEQEDVRIINLSCGLDGYHPSMHRAFSNLVGLGVLCVSAIGNKGLDTSCSPANFQGAMSVGATNRARAVSTFSAGGTMNPDGQSYHIPNLVAPGEDILSCARGGGFVLDSGTSMAAPIVSGLAARILQREPNLTLFDLRERLFNSCHNLNLPTQRQGRGLIQAR